MKLEAALFALCALPLLLTALNALTMVVIRPNRRNLASNANLADEQSEPIAVLVPMRNEERNVAGLLDSLLATEGCSKLAIIVLDDNSTDQSAELLAAHLRDHQARTPSLNVITGSELPAHWLGKNYACHQLAQSPTAVASTYLVFVDADVRLSPQAISRSIAQMERRGWDFISPYPRQIADSFIEKLIQPLLQWSFMSSLPLRLASILRFESMVVANGQFLIVRNTAYRQAGGHQAIATKVLDDIELARLLTRAGFRGGVADGSQIASCHMYNNRSELFEGYRKSLWKAFGSPLAGTFVALFLLATGLLPLLLAATGSVIFLGAYLLVVASRIIAALRTRSSIPSAALHFVSISIFTFLLWTSWQRKVNGQLTWRGRKI